MANQRPAGFAVRSGCPIKRCGTVTSPQQISLHRPARTGTGYQNSGRTIATASSRPVASRPAKRWGRYPSASPRWRPSRRGRACAAFRGAA
ncbi:MAG: hypothetical protein MZV64_60420 [Ignavibacteriales bacterium]|nr:hypothetical protein [Ignavibacteriales bacterium]